MDKRLQRELGRNFTGLVILITSFLLASAMVLADPGQDSTLIITGGNLNGQSISSSGNSITINPGEPIGGEVTVSWDSAWNPDYSAPLISTTTWDTHSNSYEGHGDAKGTGTKTISVSETAPSTPGTYYIIYAYRAEINYDDVASLTNWAYDAGVVWDDGNDIAGWSSSMISTANSNGNVQAEVLFDNGYQNSYVPSAAVEIQVSSSGGGEGISADVNVVDDFSIDHNYVFSCPTEGFTPTQFEWDFGDGTTATRDAMRNYTAVYGAEPSQDDGIYFRNTVYHSYKNEGIKTITCTATDGSQSATGTTTIDVQSRSLENSGWSPWFPTSLQMEAEHLGNTTYKITCEEIGFEANNYNFDAYGPDYNNNDLYGGPSNTRTYTFPRPGEYRVECVAGTYNTRWIDGFYQDRVHLACSSPWPCIATGGSISFSVTDTTSEDPGASSSLDYFNLNANGEFSLQNITVDPGQQIDGSLVLSYDSAWPLGTSIPLGYTPTWGDHASSFKSLGEIEGEGVDRYHFSLAAPMNPGNYYLIFAYRAEVDAGDVFSMTNWASNPEVWNDGNDIAGWSDSMIQTAISQDNIEGSVLFDEGMRSKHVPATAVPVHVRGESPGNDDDVGQCATEISELPATCKGGTKTTDSTSGSCRTIECTSDSGKLKVLACDKNSHFEMYNQEHTDNSIDLCIGETCLGGWGYRRSNQDYPICGDDGKPSEPVCGNGIIEEGETCDDSNTQNGDGCSSTCQIEEDDGTDTSVDLKIKGWYPKGRDYVFVCEESGYNADSWFWNFGDGNSQTTSTDNVYHTYQSSGQKTVTCDASGEGITESDSMQVNVE